MGEKKSLILVESPTKARTIQKYVGDKFLVAASSGHIKDLPVNKLGVDIQNNFKPQYEIIKGKEKIVEEIKRLAKSASSIYLASDPDREGEAIAWHIAELLGNKGSSVYRVLFHEITKKGVEEGIKHPGKLNQALYEAQKARRVLDRLVGYQISPILWKKVKRGLSAGRVQSIALRLICEREEQIRSFTPEEYWLIDVVALLEDGTQLTLRLKELDGKKAKIRSRDEAEKISKALKGKKILITQVDKKVISRKPAPPFITATLQQEAARRFRFSAVKTMVIAQQLYEGVEIKDLGAVGLITYMRTDSVRVNKDSITAVRKFIQEEYGEEYLPAKPIIYKNKRLAQDAHEAIRPTLLELTPEKVYDSLERDQQLLYQLIWDRFVASQMADAKYNHLTIKGTVDKTYLFVAEFEELVFPGFQKVYEERSDEEEKQKKLPSAFPEVKEGEYLKISDIKTQQKFTEPPPRYTESTLIKTLESKGIGRPSTYASIVNTIKEKHYVVKDKRSFKPTELGGWSIVC